MFKIARARSLAVVAALLFVLASCSSGDDADASDEDGAKSVCGKVTDVDCTPEEPYAFVTPIPPREPTSIDGVYERMLTEEDTGKLHPCRRCAPYRVEPGRSTLTFANGRFKVVHEVTNFASEGHYFVEGDRLRLINDIVCHDLEGIYEWDIDEEGIRLTALEDECGFGLRPKDLTSYPWTVAS